MVYGCLLCGFNLMKFKTLESLIKYKHCRLFLIDSLRIINLQRLLCPLCMVAKMEGHTGLICMEILSLGLALLSLRGNMTSWKYRPIANTLICLLLLCIMLNESIPHLYLYFPLRISKMIYMISKIIFLWIVKTINKNETLAYFNHLTFLNILLYRLDWR